MPNYTVCANGIYPFWDDLFVNTGAPQGIFYNTNGTSPNRTLTFEWYTSHYNALTVYAHFLVAFYEALPSWVTFDYLNITDSGNSATVGIESQTGKSLLLSYLSSHRADLPTAGNFSQYSYNQSIITQGVMITFNYTSGTWYNGLAPGFNGIPGAIYW